MAQNPMTPSSIVASMTDDALTSAGVVLMVTAPGDETGDAVEAELKKIASSVVRMDVGDFPVRLRLAVTNDSSRSRGRLWTDDVAVEIDQIRSVYYRRPTHFNMPPGLSDGDSAFAKTEARLGPVFK